MFYSFWLHDDLRRCSTAPYNYWLIARARVLVKDVATRRSAPYKPFIFRRDTHEHRASCNQVKCSLQVPAQERR